MPLDPATPGAKDRKSTPDARIQAARGEVESFQLVIRSTEPIKVKLSSLKLVGGEGDAVIDGASITAYRQLPVSVIGASPGGFGERGVTGRDPVLDPLQRIVKRERMQVGPDQPLVIWVDVQVPTNAVPGMYSGDMRVQIGAKSRAVTKVRVEVSETVLPPESPVATSFGIDLRQLEEQEGVDLNEKAGEKMLDKYVNLLAQHRLVAADINIPKEIGTDPGSIEGSAAMDRLDLVAARSEGSTIRFPIYATYPVEDPLGSDRNEARSYLRTVAQVLRERGLLDRSYLYVVDEPAISDGPRVKDWVALALEADPQIRMLLTTTPNPAFGDGIDIWSPNLNGTFSATALRNQIGPNPELWTYQSVSTQYPLPTIFSDDPRPSARAMGWLAYSQKLDGILYWTVNHWQEVDNPWSEGGTFRDSATGAIANGDGVLVYPAKPKGLKSPAPSIRLKLLRDGIEDNMLLSVIASSRAGGSRSADLFAAQLASSPNRFETRPLLVAEIRRRMLARGATPAKAL